MRTTLAIDDDILAAARHLAERDQKTVGAIISALARAGLSKIGKSQRNGIALLPSGGDGVAVTMELVNQLRDQAA